MALSDEEMLEEVGKVLTDELEAYEPLEGDKITIAGVEFVYEVDSEMHSDKLNAFLTSTNTEGKSYRFVREGYKEISYESWISSIWFSWNIDN